MVTAGRFEDAAALVVDVQDAGPRVADAESVARAMAQAMALLREAGFAVILLAPETSVRIRRSRPRRWWRSRERKERA